MKRQIALGLVLAAGFPGAAMAADGKPKAKDTKENAAAACKAERAAMGEQAFRALYGTNEKGSNAYGKCVSKRSKKSPEANEAAKEESRSAAKDCKAERKADPAAFKEKYGTNKNKKNAFGKCVSATAKANHEAEEEQEAPTAA